MELIRGHQDFEGYINIATYIGLPPIGHASSELLFVMLIVNIALFFAGLLYFKILALRATAKMQKKGCHAAREESKKAEEKESEGMKRNYARALRRTYNNGSLSGTSSVGYLQKRYALCALGACATRFFLIYYTRYAVWRDFLLWQNRKHSAPRLEDRL